MEIPGSEDLDVIVVGAGNAAACAALSAQENGARVLMLEIAPEEARAGNSAFTGGASRSVYHGAEDLARLIPDMNETELRDVDFGTYTEEQYFDDMGRLTQYRCDPDMTEILIRSSFDTGVWMRGKGVRFQLGLGRQAFRVDGKFKFWGGLACHIWGGGKELMKALHARAPRGGVWVFFETPAIGRLRGQCRDAGALSRAELGPRQGARLALQYRAGAEDGARSGRRRHRPLVGSARRRLGSQCPALWRPRCRRPLSEAQLSVRDHRQCPGRAPSRRGPRFPQLHLAQIRRRDPEPARDVRLADL